MESKPTKRFWLRWFGGKDGDPRPIVYPVPIEWWCTGERCSDGMSTICAIVDAPNEAKAWVQVAKYWPEMEPSFADEKSSGWRPSPDRFPPQEVPDGQ